MAIDDGSAVAERDVVASMKRERGRPRIFADEDVFFAVPIAFDSTGYHQVTLATIAAIVGTTAQALIRRFGSKQLLIQNYLEWSIAQQVVTFAEIERMPGSPLSHIYDGATVPAKATDGKRNVGIAYLNMLDFAYEIREDPLAASLADRRSTVIELGVERLLRAAIASGELLPMNTAAIARLALSALVGVHFRHASRVGPSLDEQVRDALDTILSMYRHA